MRPIKFRGRTAEGKLLYGDLLQINGKAVIFGKACDAVEPDSVAQLVGYDCDGNEVYEGDIIVDEHKGETPVMFLAILFNGKLKEAKSWQITE